MRKAFLTLAGLLLTGILSSQVHASNIVQDVKENPGMAIGAGAGAAVLGVPGALIGAGVGAVTDNVSREVEKGLKQFGKILGL